MSTVAGSGVRDFADGLGSAAKFCYPYGIAVALNGAVFVADADNHRIRIVTTAGFCFCLVFVMWLHYWLSAPVFFIS